MALVSSGSDKCREAAADALAALGDVAARDPANRELLKLKVRCRPFWLTSFGDCCQWAWLWGCIYMQNRRCFCEPFNYGPYGP